MGYQRRIHGDFGPVFTFDSSERTASQTPKITMAELGLKKKEIDAINFAFDVYDFKGDGKVDAFYAGDLVRACNLNPTLKTIKEIGGGVAKGEKFLSKPDVFPMYKACKDSKDQGGFHDFVEILKLYDKNADDTILEFELFKLLVNLGEKLTKEEAKNLMKELCDPADDEGFTLSLSSEYKKSPTEHHTFLERLMNPVDQSKKYRIHRNTFPRPRSLD